MTLYPAIEPRETFHLSVGDGHEIYVERVGTPGAASALFLHGGPGTGASALARRLFDPARFDVTLFDQRGALRSRPLGSLDANTSDHLVEDIVRLRRHLGLERWMVVGGSWGSALALAYAAREPECVDALVLRGIYLGTRGEDLWQYQKGADRVLPEAFAAYRDFIPQAERQDLIAAYHRRLVGPATPERLAAARAFLLWGQRTNHFARDEEGEALIREDYAAPFIEATARIAAHYAVNGSFFGDRPLLQRAAVLGAIPTHLIHGRYDLACPLSSAFALKAAMPHARLEIVEAAGHALGDPRLVPTVMAAIEAARISLTRRGV